MADDDKQIELRKRARRRLVGAVALALFAAIVLPMVMDAEPRPVEQDIQVRIPAQEGDNAVARPIADPAAPSAAVALEPDRPDVTPPPVVLAAPTEASAKPATRPEPVKPEPSPPESPPPALVDEAARAAAILAGKPVPASSAPQAAGGFVIQLGAYRDQSNANSLRGRLKAEGYPSYTEKAGDKTRVRVGPYPSREAADKAMAKLRQTGLNGAVLPL